MGISSFGFPGKIRGEEKDAVLENTCERGSIHTGAEICVTLKFNMFCLLDIQD